MLPEKVVPTSKLISQQQMVKDRHFVLLVFLADVILLDHALKRHLQNISVIYMAIK